MLRNSLQLERYAFRPAEAALPASLRSSAIVSAAQLRSDVPAKEIRTMRVGFIGLDHAGNTMASRLSGWPSDANVVQLSANCSGANLFQFLARHSELRAPQDRSQVASLTFLDIETNLDIETEGVLQ